MSTMECKKCSLEIDNKTDMYTICEWRCAKSFHAACIGLSENAANTLSRNNILWICDECMVEFGRTRDKLYGECSEITDEPTTIEQDISDLKAKVAEISETLTSIAPQRMSQNTNNQLHSTPVSSHALLDGTGTHQYEDSFTETAPAGNGTHSTSVEDHSTFALFLTNIDSHATENDIHVLVCQSLGIAETNRLRVRKLVPKWRMREEIDFISFKVILNYELKAKAMNPATWPCGVRYREFVQLCNIWKPNR